MTEVHSGLTISEILEALEPTPATQWCEEVFKEYEDASTELEALRADPKVTDTHSIIGAAKISRAQKRLAATTIKSNAASLVLQLKQSTDRGEIYFDLPEIALQIRIKW